MTVLKATVVLLLVSAAAVIIPLRRAQRAFAAISGHSGYSAAHRPVLRRRTNGPRANLRSAAQDAPTTASAEASRNDHPHPTAPKRVVSAAPGTDTQTIHADCALLGRAQQLPQPERLTAHVASPQLVVTAQAVGDTPVPPPKLS